MKEQVWNEYEVFEGLVSKKSYSELSADELNLVNQFIANEQEYEAFRISGLKMKRWFRENPVVGVTDKALSGLKRDFKRAHQSEVSFSWWKVSVGYAMAAIVFGFGGWWIGQSTNENSQTQTFNPVVVHDTIFVASKPDTIFTERVVYKNQPVILTRNHGTSDENKSIEKNGINMKEKEELEKLLVSGTE